VVIGGMIRVSLAAMFLALPASASDSWFCQRNIGTKSFTFTYRVDGNLLIVNNGAAHSTILENNSDHVISYVSFTTDVTRYPANHAPVLVAEPSLSYIIIEKASGRFTELSSIAMEILVNTYGALPPPDVQTGTCKPN
jgi:hypothetical protein